MQINKTKEVALAKFNLSPEKPVLLVLGGSLGARAINKLIADHLPFILKQGVQLLWQTGKIYYEQYMEMGSLKDVKVMEYIDAMNLAYSAADVIISRAGAGSVSELCIVGKPVIFIPSPNVAEDHQTKNAQAIVKHHAAIMIPEVELNKTFDGIFEDLMSTKIQQQELSENIKKLALPNATETIVDEIEKIIKKPDRKYKLR